jgi:hypothetical protein
MLESPLIQELMAQRDQQLLHYTILDNLEGRFGSVPPEMTAEVRGTSDERKLRELHRLAAVCPDLESFRAAMRS